MCLARRKIATAIAPVEVTPFMMVLALTQLLTGAAVPMLAKRPVKGDWNKCTYFHISRGARETRMLNSSLLSQLYTLTSLALPLLTCPDHGALYLPAASFAERLCSPSDTVPSCRSWIVGIVVALVEDLDTMPFDYLDVKTVALAS